MSEAFRECLKKKKIIPFPRAKGFIKKELKASYEDLSEAKDRLKHEKYKYATINSYYSIFHSSRALLYSKNFRERSHYCLLIALEVLFVKSGIISSHFIAIFKNSMSLRENADYSSSFLKESALLNISYAQEFLEMAKRILS